jgi:ABC-type multidrug transport system ATPase subunit
MNAFEVNGVTKKYKKPPSEIYALQDCKLEVASGHFTVVLGLV